MMTVPWGFVAAGSVVVGYALGFVAGALGMARWASRLSREAQTNERRKNAWMDR